MICGGDDYFNFTSTSMYRSLLPSNPNPNATPGPNLLSGVMGDNSPGVDRVVVPCVIGRDVVSVRSGWIERGSDIVSY